jgi:hypothetical protein
MPCPVCGALGLGGAFHHSGDPADTVVNQAWCNGCGWGAVWDDGQPSPWGGAE